jgi:hypothetical protein
MAAFFILATVLALSGLVSVAMAWGVLGSVLYVMRIRATRATPSPNPTPAAVVSSSQQ